MAKKIEPKSLGIPISDERLEALKVQVQYGANVTVTLLREELGQLISRLELAEFDRRLARRALIKLAGGMWVNDENVRLAKNAIKLTGRTDEDPWTEGLIVVVHPDHETQVHDQGMWRFDPPIPCGPDNPVVVEVGKESCTARNARGETRVGRK